jgi:hypothetical protein
MKKKLLIIGSAVAVIGLGIYMKTPRGIRNNNPGNIRHSPSEWVGERAVQYDPAFVQFTAPEYGIRALAKLILNYKKRYGLETVEGIISRWAPPNENNTQSYINAVADRMGTNPDWDLVLFKGSHDLINLVNAIIWHENGENPYTLATIEKGIDLV